MGNSPAQRGFAMQKMIRPTAGAPCSPFSILSPVKIPARTSAHPRATIRTRILRSSFFTPHLENGTRTEFFPNPNFGPQHLPTREMGHLSQKPKERRTQNIIALLSSSYEYAGLGSAVFTPLTRPLRIFLAKLFLNSNLKF